MHRADCRAMANCNESELREERRVIHESVKDGDLRSASRLFRAAGSAKTSRIYRGQPRLLAIALENLDADALAWE